MSNKDQEYDKMIDKTKKIALGDDDIHNFFPKAKILTLNRFNLLLVEKTLIMIDVKFRCGFKKQAFRNEKQS